MINQQSAIFRDRKDAGRKLAKELFKYQSANPLVLGLPRGGIVIGYEVSRMLHSPLNVIVARKIGAPDNPELGIGAVAENNIVIIDYSLVKLFGLTNSEVNNAVEREMDKVANRVRLFRHGKSLPSLRYQTVILVDDGLATGVTAEAAIKAILEINPYQLIYASPVCAYESAANLRSKVDAVECVYAPYDLNAISMYYHNFSQTTDEEVIELLKKAEANYSLTHFR